MWPCGFRVAFPREPEAIRDCADPARKGACNEVKFDVSLDDTEPGPELASAAVAVVLLLVLAMLPRVAPSGRVLLVNLTGPPVC